MVHKESGKRAFVQVKTGNARIDHAWYVEIENEVEYQPGDKVYVFQARNRYIGDRQPIVVELSKSVLESFLSKTLVNAKADQELD